ncbi:MAG: translocation/assembly module TamB domain-containing protein [Candidatus Krumholzibacteria bacterium]|jgi:hypothetical protein|nr:translocation/assembly module TamB domain-containing protein [Candidatus Krumholzibacteria bacterium]MDP6796911.1 translocation/assembly module TamB domain-containing protein [Candidatus Krumholzibacteria bacterium]MDP7021730.1 translocation/assembly module TamB domain-containing protein [Candidatus Krumholzibacteria bacterium]
MSGKKTGRIAGIVILIVLLLGYGFLHLRQAWFARQMAGLISRNLLSELSLTLDLEAIQWKPLGGLLLRGAELRGDNEDFEPILEIGEADLRFRFRNLLRGQLFSPSLELEGCFLRPSALQNQGGEAPAGMAALVYLEDCRLRDFQILMESGDTLSLDSAELRLLKNRDGLLLEIESLKGTLPGGLTLLDMEGSFFHDQALKLREVKIQLPGSAFQIDGRIETGDSLSYDLEIEADSLLLKEALALFGKTFDRQDRLSGHMNLSGAPSGLELEGKLSGSLYGYELAELETLGQFHDGQLTLDRMDGELNRNFLQSSAQFRFPRAGKGLGLSMEGQLQHFDLNRFFGGGPVSDLQGDFHLEKSPETLSLGLQLGEGHLIALPFASAYADLEFSGDTLHVNRSGFLDTGLSLNLTGWINPREATLQLEGSGESRSSALSRRFSGDTLLQGDLDFQLSAGGSALAPDFSLEGDYRNTTYLGTGISSGHLLLESDSLLRAPLEVELTGKALKRGDWHFEEGFLRGQILPGALDLDFLSLDGQDWGLTLSGLLPFGEKEDWFLRQCWLHWQGHDWLNDRAFLYRPGERLPRGSVDFRSRGGHLSFRRESEEAGQLVWRDLDLQALLPDSLNPKKLEARSNGWIERREDGSLELSLSLDEFSLASSPPGQLNLDAGWKDDVLNLSSLRWEEARGGQVWVSGQLTGMPPSGDASLRIPEAPESLELELLFSDFSLGKLHSLLPGTGKLQGLLSGNLQLEGPLEELSSSASMHLDSLSIEDWALLESLDFDAEIEGGGLYFKSLELKQGPEQRSRIRSEFLLPASLSFPGGLKLEKDDALEGQLFLDARLEDLPDPLGWLAEGEGDLRGKLLLEGSPSHPQPRGELSLDKGRLRLAGTEELFEEVRIEARVEGDSIFLEEVEAQEGLRYLRQRNGHLKARGWLTWYGPLRYQLSATLSDFALGTLPFFRGDVSGDLSLQRQWSGEAWRPFLEGQLLVSSGELQRREMGIGSESSGSALDYRLKLRADGQLFLRDAESDLELAGDITLESLPSGFDISGELDILRGRYLIFWNHFRLLEGHLDFNGTRGFNPMLDIRAESRTSDDLITLTVSNTLQEPKVSLESKSGYSEEDALRILAGLPPGDVEGMESLRGALGGKIATGLISQLENWATGELLSGVIQSVEIENRGAEGEEETRWQIASYLPGGVYVTYNQGLSQNSSHELGIEKRVRDWVVLRMEVLRQSEQLGEEGTADAYNFDIRFRYEY